MDYSLNIRGNLLNLHTPQVMGILNVTPDSFYADSRRQTAQEISERANRIVQEGAAIIDVGACSTRPGSEPVSQDEEMRRLRLALDVVRRELPFSVLSVDTFRPDVARMAVEEFGADIINDVGAPVGCSDTEERRLQMFRVVSRLRVAYVAMSSQPDLRSVLLDLSRQVQQLRDCGQKDIIVDPGFGFGKTLEENHRLLGRLDCLQALELPVLVGVSRKSMITRRLNITAQEALNGTTVLHTIALMRGASVLRVHDVKEAVECVSLVYSK